MRRAVFVLLMFAASASWGQMVFIDEIHYENPGADMCEFVETAGTADTDPLWIGPAFESPGSANFGKTLPVELIAFSVE